MLKSNYPSLTKKSKNMNRKLKTLTNYLKIAFTVLFVVVSEVLISQNKNILVEVNIGGSDKLLWMRTEDMFEDTLFSFNSTEVMNIARAIKYCEGLKDELQSKDSLIILYEQQINEMQNNIRIKQEIIDQCNNLRKDNIESIIDCEKKYNKLSEDYKKVNNSLHICKGITFSLSGVILAGIGVYYLTR